MSYLRATAASSMRGVPLDAVDHPHRAVVADQLEEVAVAGDDVDRSGPLIGVGADDVVGLELGDPAAGQPDRVEDRFDDRHLRSRADPGCRRRRPRRPDASCTTGSPPPARPAASRRRSRPRTPRARRSRIWRASTSRVPRTALTGIPSGAVTRRRERRERRGNRLTERRRARAGRLPGWMSGHARRLACQSERRDRCGC